MGWTRLRGEMRGVFVTRWIAQHRVMLLDADRYPNSISQTLYFPYSYSLALLLVLLPLLILVLLLVLVPILHHHLPPAFRLPFNTKHTFLKNRDFSQSIEEN